MRDLPQELRGANALAEGGLTDRVNRCLTVADALEMESGELVRRMSHPNRAEAAKTAAPEPEPSHIVFALEKLERMLERARRNVSGIAEAL